MENEQIKFSPCGLFTGVVVTALAVIMFGSTVSNRMVVNFGIDLTQTIPLTSLLYFFGFSSLYSFMGGLALITGIMSRKPDYLGYFLTIEALLFFPNLMLLIGLGSFWFALVIVFTKIYICGYIAMLAVQWYKITEREKNLTAPPSTDLNQIGSDKV
jgi:hypothetical protein